MRFESIKVARISDSIVSQIEEMILDGALKPGDQLPPERELAQQLEVSRPSLREALVILEAKGLIDARRGGGTFVSDALAHSFTDPLVHLLDRRPDTAFDVLELRVAMEEVSAYFAAVRANETDRNILRRRFGVLEASYDGERDDNVNADVEFHMAVADASHNVALVHVMRSLFSVVHATIRDNLERIYGEAEGKMVIQTQHRALFEAVMAGDPEAARDAAHTHLGFVVATLREGFLEKARERRSRRRLRTFDP